MPNLWAKAQEWFIQKTDRPLCNQSRSRGTTITTPSSLKQEGAFTSGGLWRAGTEQQV